MLHQHTGKCMGTVTLFELDQEDIKDLLQLIASPSLTIPANYARRVYELQAKLANLKPSVALEEKRNELEVFRGALDATEKERQEWIARASAHSDELAKLEAELARARAELEEFKGTAAKVCARIEAVAGVEVCDCGHQMIKHDSAGCEVGDCICMRKP